jgi:hypothetical protein
VDTNSTENDISKIGIRIEVVDAEPLSEAEMDRLADLFADEIIEKMLKKAHNHDRRDTARNK